MRYKPRGWGLIIDLRLFCEGDFVVLERPLYVGVYFRNVKDLHLVHMVTNFSPQCQLLLSNSPFSPALHTHSPGTWAVRAFQSNIGFSGMARDLIWRTCETFQNLRYKRLKLPLKISREEKIEGIWNLGVIKDSLPQSPSFGRKCFSTRGWVMV